MALFFHRRFDLTEIFVLAFFVYVPYMQSANYRFIANAGRLLRKHVAARVIYKVILIGLYYKNATHQLTNVTETHEKGLRKRIRIMYEIA